MKDFYHIIRKALQSLLFFVITSNYCVAQKLEMKYYPAFHNNSRCTIFCENDSCKMQLDIFEFNDSSEVIWSETRLVPFESFKQLNDFFVSNDELFDHAVIGLDGINIKGQYEDGIITKKFKYWSPMKGTQKHELLKMSIDVLGKYMKEKKSKSYLRRLKKYLN